MTLSERWHEFLNAIWQRIARWLEIREAKSCFKRNVCPLCHDKYSSTRCPVCSGIKIIPWTPGDRVAIRDRYQKLTGINLFE
jgi:hypothetical protein